MVEQNRGSKGASRRQFVQYIGGATAVGTALTAGCLGGDETDDGQMDVEIIPSSGGADTLDPHQSAGIPAASLTSNIYEGLLTRSPMGEIEPQLATDWYRVEPGQYRFELREGVSWHDGSELTAEDAAYSIRRIVDDDVGGIVSDRQGHVIGIDDAVAVDDYTLDVLSDGLNTMVETAAASYLGIAIMQEDFIEGNDLATVGTDAVGTGPHEVVEFVGEDTALLEPFDDYWGDVPEFGEVRYTGVEESATRVNQLLADEVDLIETLPPADVPRVVDEDGISFDSEPASRVIHGVMDVTVEPWDSVEFRRAMNYAVDNEEYIENILQGFGTVSSQPGLPEMYGYNPDLDPYEYDPARAEELIEESGYGGMELELSFGVGRMLLDVEFVTAIAGYIDDLDNVSCEVNELDLTTFGTLWNDEPDPDEMDFFIVGYGHPAFNTAQSLNAILLDPFIGRWARGESDAYFECQSLVEEAAGTEDVDDREELLQEAAAIAHEEAAWLFCHQQESIYGINDDFDWQPRRDELMSARNAGPAE